LRISIPKRTKPTPVQKLNRDGVKQIEKHNYGEAKKLFYKAYLLDPNDPFTLNNLGYIAELEGNEERAQRFYELAQQQTSDALVDASSNDDAKGKTLSQVAGHADQKNMEVNRLNVQALTLLLKDRAPEADMILTRSLALDRSNPFTLNNLGYAKEKEGEYEAALGYYLQAANQHSNMPIVVTANKDWRGKPISDVAGDNASNVRKLLRRQQEDRGFQVAMLNLRGVSAINRNEPQAARQYFQQANKLAPGDAFTLNNMGYLAEMEGDRESAQFFYEKAQQAQHAGERIGVATKKEAEGHQLNSVAEISESQVDQSMAASAAQRRNLGPPTLKRRPSKTNTPAPETTQPPAPQNNSPQPQ
jgi:Flp pilus assembly protein TadD